MGSPALFSGNFVKFLKSQLNLFDAAYILTGSVDPRSSATNAPKGSIYLHQNASGNGQMFVKLDNGTTTNWQVLALDTVYAQSLVEALRNESISSPYEIVTPNVFGIDGTTKTNVATATYSVPNRNYQFSEDFTTTWTARAAFQNTWIHAIWVQELTKFIAVGLAFGGNNGVMTSPDGLTWTRQTTPNANGWLSVAWSPSLGLLAAVSQDGTNRIMTSPDGITWTSRVQPASNTRVWRSITWADTLGLFVAVASGTGGGTGNLVMTSPDGITWTGRTEAATLDWGSVCWSHELNMLVAVAGSGTGNRVMTSFDGINWTSQTSAEDNNWMSVCWSPELGLFVAVAQSGTNRVMTSPNGVTWTARSAASAIQWRNVIWVPEMQRFIAAAQSGTSTVMTSPDGITWTGRSGSTLIYGAIAWSSQLLRAAGVSQSGITNSVHTSDAQYVESVQHADATAFLNRGLDIGSVDLTAFWSATNPPSTIYHQVSRDGGTNWFPVTMTRIDTTNTWFGSLNFDKTYTTEALKQTVFSIPTTDGANFRMSNTSGDAVAQQFTVSATTKLQSVKLRILKVGSPIGSIFASIIKDGGGFPSAAASDIVAQSLPVAITSLTSGTDFIVDIPDVVVTAGTYFVVLTTDSTYKSQWVFNTTEIKTVLNSTAASAPYALTWNGASWTTQTGINMYTTVFGRAIDLRVRAIAPAAAAYPAAVDGYGVFYSLQNQGVVTAVRKTQRFSFNSTTDNLSTFTITTFVPDPDLLTCYYVEGGQVFKVPAFSLNGNQVVFPTNSFNNGGVSATVTLIFDQNSGGSFDNSDTNANLLAQNHLGSTNGAYDRSQAGRGIILRRLGDGLLREVAVDQSDNLFVLSVP